MTWDAAAGQRWSSSILDLEDCEPDNDDGRLQVYGRRHTWRLCLANLVLASCSSGACKSRQSRWSCRIGHDLPPRTVPGSFSPRELAKAQDANDHQPKVQMASLQVLQTMDAAMRGAFFLRTLGYEQAGGGRGTQSGAKQMKKPGGEHRGRLWPDDICNPSFPLQTILALFDKRSGKCLPYRLGCTVGWLAPGLPTQVFLY